MYLLETPTILTGFNLLIALLGLIILVGAAIIVLLARRKETVSGLQLERATASEALVKTRDIQIEDCRKECEECKEELEDTTAELRGQMAINVSELMRYWQKRDGELALIEDLQERIRVLERRASKDGK